MTENKQQQPILIGGFLGTLRKRVNSPLRKSAFPGGRLREMALEEKREVGEKTAAANRVLDRSASSNLSSECPRDPMSPPNGREVQGAGRR
jgi:hypothetical protein